MKSVSLLIFMLLGFAATAQKTSGEISYERVKTWSRINNRMTFLSKEEKERAATTWANNDEQKQDFVLLFNEKQSYYSYPAKEDLSEGGYSWQKDEYKIYRDFEKEKRTDIIAMLGKTYILEDSLKVPKWKVMNKIKEVAGYMCMMAVTEDTTKGQKITAWFADNIPVSAGPELYSGLPGLILELDINEGDVVITAKEVKMREVKDEEMALPKKMKGKKLDTLKYEQLVAEHIRDSMKAHRNPYWSMPY